MIKVERKRKRADISIKRGFSLKILRLSRINSSERAVLADIG